MIKISKKDQKEMNFAMRLSFFIGLIILLFKTYAYSITGSAAILSDAAESIIHVFAVGFAAYSMWLSLQPADDNHLYGHDKISFFSAGFEGAIIIIASFYIIYESLRKAIFGFELENVDTGLFFIILATIINAMLSVFLIRKGKKHQSLILEANGKHILTDCYTSVGVLIALILVKLTGIMLIDPIIGILTAINILWTGLKLIKRSVGGLMDQTDLSMHKQIRAIVLKETSKNGLGFSHLRHRSSGQKIFLDFQLIFSQDLSLQQAHANVLEIESAIKAAFDVPIEIVCVPIPAVRALEG